MIKVQLPWLAFILGIMDFHLPPTGRAPPALKKLPQLEGAILILHVPWILIVWGQIPEDPLGGSGQRAHRPPFVLGDQPSAGFLFFLLPLSKLGGGETELPALDSVSIISFFLSRQSPAALSMQ